MDGEIIIKRQMEPPTGYRCNFCSQWQDTEILIITWHLRARPMTRKGLAKDRPHKFQVCFSCFDNIKAKVDE